MHTQKYMQNLQGLQKKNSLHQNCLIGKFQNGRGGSRTGSRELLSQIAPSWMLQQS